jgi:hypothetical protein
MNDYLTISQIEEITNVTRYIRQLDYTRAIALTLFLRELEAKHRDSFRLCTLSPKIIYNYSLNGKEVIESSKVFAIGLWAEWQIDETYYYMEMNDNIFFDAWIARSWKIDRKFMRKEHMTTMNDILYGGWVYDFTPRALTLLINNFHAGIKYVEKQSAPTYMKEISAYDRTKKQTIYK